MKKKKTLILFTLMTLLCFNYQGKLYTIIPSSSYSPYSGGIVIHTNSEFHSLASAKGWAGDGLTEATAYIIEDLNITNADYEMIMIREQKAMPTFM